MAYHQALADRIREALVDIPGVTERLMFGGMCFMVNEKMCIGVVKDEMMCRIDPLMEEEALGRPGCRPMDFTGRPMKGYVFVDEQGMKTRKLFDYWIGLCLDFNAKAKKSAKKSKP